MRTLEASQALLESLFAQLDDLPLAGSLELYRHCGVWMQWQQLGHHVTRLSFGPVQLPDLPMFLFGGLVVGNAHVG